VYAYGPVFAVDHEDWSIVLRVIPRIGLHWVCMRLCWSGRVDQFLVIDANTGPYAYTRQTVCNVRTFHRVLYALQRPALRPAGLVNMISSRAPAAMVCGPHPSAVQTPGGRKRDAGTFEPVRWHPAIATSTLNGPGPNVSGQLMVRQPVRLGA